VPDELRALKHFVGRADELRALRRHLFGAGATRALARLWGVGGLGKTALAAEAIHLWGADFDLVLGVRPAGDQALSLEGWLQDVDYHVLHSLGIQGYRIWDEFAEGLARERWLAGRLDELLRFLNSHRALLVIDNFEPNLRRVGEAGELRYVCADPEWGRTLARLAGELSPGLSCLLLTSRRAPGELLGAPNVVELAVGPLDAGEWWTFARTAPHLRRLWLGSEEERALLLRALSVARGHPLILNALEQLAARPQELARRLDEFEARGGHYAGAGELLAAGETPEARAAQMAYFEEIAAHSLRALIEDRSPAAQRLLRVITLALEAVDDDLIAYVWEDEGFSEEMPRLQPAGQGWRAPLGELLAAGLLTAELRTGTRADGSSVEKTTYVWHPMVAEQAAEVLPDGEAFPEAAYRRRYAVRNLSMFSRYRQPQSRAQAEIALAAARDAVPYLLRLGDSGTAVAVINDIHALSQALDFRRDLQGWIRQLLDQVPPGEQREVLLQALADVYKGEGRPQAALPLYRQALESAEARGDWLSCGISSHQLGIAHTMANDYPAARAAYRSALRYKRRAGKLNTARLSSLAELARLLVIEGGARNLARARTHAAWHAAIARAYYQRCQADPAAVEAKSVATPEHMLIGVLDLQRMAEARSEDWAAALRICEEQLELDQHHHHGELAVAEDVFNRATYLLRLGRLDEAEQDLRFCRRVFHNHQQPVYEAKVLSQLGTLADRQADPARAAQFETQALAIRHRLGALSDAAISHNNLDIYLGKVGQTEEAILEGCCAALIRALTGEQQELLATLWNVSIDLHEFPPAEHRAHWPTAVALFGKYPELGELLAARGVDAAAAQGVLDRSWEVVAEGVGE
jgi:tetratricopeptide (TPR) repeat protein